MLRLNILVKGYQRVLVVEQSSSGCGKNMKQCRKCPVHLVRHDLPDIIVGRCSARVGIVDESAMKSSKRCVNLVDQVNIGCSDKVHVVLGQLDNPIMRDLQRRST